MPARNVNISIGGSHDRHHHPRRPDRPPGARQPARQRRTAPGHRPRSVPAPGRDPRGPRHRRGLARRRGGCGQRIRRRRRVFWLTPVDPRAPSVDAAFAGFTRPAAEAFHRHGVGRAVGVSMLGRGTPWAGRAGFVTGSLAMDDLIAASGVAYRALTNPYFMEDTLRQAESIKNQSVFSYPIAGDRKRPAVATRDIAAAASRLLLDARWSGVEEVPLLGPEDLSFNDMAEIMSQVLDKDVRFQQITFEAYKARFIRLGVSDAMAQ